MFAPISLPDALDRLGFVQADPIRAPARAQELILRHRVRGYSAGDLDRRYGRLGLEEDFLYAYGFMPPATAALLHPRPEGEGPSALAMAVLAFVRGRGPTHPRDLEERFGAGRAVNAWGGISKATTRALEELRHHGRLRVAGRAGGIRTYVAAGSIPQTLDAAERARRLVLLVASLLAPVSAPSLRGALSLMAKRNQGLGKLAPVVAGLVADGCLASEAVDGERYLWPAAASPAAARRDVRLLAPFDPVVWDRRRFEHLHGWTYRFEAYTPPARRVLGYYAMPLLWGDCVIGWANLSFAGGTLDASVRYAGAARTGVAFKRGLDAELARLERFLRGRG